ncbi:MAG: HEAT repeat domain-containing protein [Candidatus Omnitrophica bacterium]|nr:HEAT repeat domain-containing protein [Candidatus Omnitrophota bacterium]
MRDYYVDIVWPINIAILAAVILTVAAIIICLILKDYIWHRRRQELLDIKSNVYEMAISGRKKCVIPKSSAPRLTSRQLIDIETNRGRDMVFFNDSEQEMFKKCFITPEYIAALSRTVKNSWSKRRRIEAIICLGYSGSDKAVDALAGPVLSRDTDIAYFSIIALGRIKTPRSAGLLLRAMKNSPANRLKISSLLDGFPPETADEIIKFTDDKDPDLRALAITLLARFNPVKYIKKLESLAEDKSPEVRAAACECLGASGSAQAGATLVERLKDGNWLVKTRAVLALEKVEGAAALPEVINLISDASWSVVDAVKDVMTSHIKESLPYIEKFISGKDEIAKKYSAIALENSGYVTELLGRIAEGRGDSRDLRLLEGVIKSGLHFGVEAAVGSLDSAGRAAAVKAIGKIDRKLAGHIKRRLSALERREGPA